MGLRKDWVIDLIEKNSDLIKIVTMAMVLSPQTVHTGTLSAILKLAEMKKNKEGPW